MKKLTQRRIEKAFTEYSVVGIDKERTFTLGNYQTLRQALTSLKNSRKLTHQFNNIDLRVIKLCPQFVEMEDYER